MAGLSLQQPATEIRTIAPSQGVRSAIFREVWLQRVRQGVCGLAVAFAAARGGAAEVSFRGPPECERAEGVREQIERVVGRPLAEAEHADFAVSVEQAANHSWRATVRTTPRGPDPSPSEREFRGKTCAEVSDAAAVAIAMAIEQHDKDVDAEAPAANANSAETQTPNKPAPPPARSRPPTSPAWKAMLGAQGTIDAGALPNPSPGAELDLSAGFGKFHAMLLGAFLTPQTKRLANGNGGEFQLSLVGLLACGERPLGTLSARGCLGFELGQLAAEGAGVKNPRIGNGAWRAARVDLGAGWPLGAGLWLTFRTALVAPLARQTFVLNGTERIFRPSSFGARGLLGLELEI